MIAAYGAAKRGFVEGYEASDAGAYSFLVDLLSNVAVFDPGARESVITFASGIGDVLLTYENEYYAGIAAGDEYAIVYPRSTVLIENPVAVVDTYAAAHGVTDVADAFVEFLFTPEAQAIFVSKGYRPPVYASSEVEAEATAEATAEAPLALWPEGALDPAVFPTIDDLFTVQYYGGWHQIGEDFFSESGIYSPRWLL